MGCKASIGVVTLVLSTSCSLAASVDRNDPKYANCTSARGFLNFASPSYPLRSSGLVYQANGPVKPITKFTHQDFVDLEEKILICNDVSGPPRSREYVHSALERIEAKFHEVALAPARKELERFRGRALTTADVQRLKYMRAETPDLAPDIDAVLATNAAATRDAEMTAAKGELQGFAGRVLLPAELQRAITLGREFPDLAPQVDALTSSQDALKRDAGESARREQEKAESDARIAADRQRAANERALAEANAKAEEAAKKARFEASLPGTCKAALSTMTKLRSPEAEARGSRASALGAAGDTASACGYLKDLSGSVEQARSDFVACSKELDGNADLLAVNASSNALAQAVDLHGKQADIAESLNHFGCLK